jgi:hypothetical protein
MNGVSRGALTPASLLQMGLDSSTYRPHSFLHLVFFSFLPGRLTGRAELLKGSDIGFDSNNSLSSLTLVGWSLVGHFEKR